MDLSGGRPGIVATCSVRSRKGYRKGQFIRESKSGLSKESMGGFFLSSGTLIFRLLARLDVPGAGGHIFGGAEVSLREDGDLSCCGITAMSS